MSFLIDPSGLKPARLYPPISKSDAHRALVLSHVCNLSAPGEITETGGLPRDVVTLSEGLRKLRQTSGAPTRIDCQDAGAPFRFLLGQAAIEPNGRFQFTGTERLGERPHRALIHALLAALEMHGLAITEGNPWPISVTGATGTGKPLFHISGAESSQYVSSLLLVAAALLLREHRPWTVRLTGGTTSAGYLALTLHWLARAGFTVTDTSGQIVVTKHSPRKTLGSVPGDWSSIAYLLAINWRSGGTVGRVDPSAPHPDRAVVNMLERAGLLVRISDAHEARVEGSAVSGIEASAKDTPDLIPTLAAVACVLPKPSVFHDVAILEGKESNRLEATADLVQAFGHRAVVHGNTLTVIPAFSSSRPTARLSTRADHRMAMAAATLAVLAATPVEIDDAACVTKSFPGFWEEIAKAGIQLTKV